MGCKAFCVAHITAAAAPLWNDMGLLVRRAAAFCRLSFHWSYHLSLQLQL